MLPIYICEDDKYQLDNIKEKVLSYFYIKYPGMTPHIYTFTNPYDFLESLNSKIGPNIYLLDYDLRCDMNGLKLAQEIRKIDAIGIITFITTHEECWKLSHEYSVSAMNFIIKEEYSLQKNISQALDNSLMQYQIFQEQTKESYHQPLVIKSGMTIHHIKQSDIYYFKISEKEHIIDIYSKNSVIHPRGTINGILDKLDKSMFFQCNRSTVININHIESIELKGLEIKLKGQVFHVSKLKFKELTKLLN